MTGQAEGELLRRWLDDSRAPRGRAEILLRAGRPGEAAARAEQELRRRPDEPRWLCLSAIARMAAGEPAAAQRHLNRVIRKHPRQALAWGLKGLLLDSRSDALDRAARLEPAVGWPLALRSQFFRARGELGACLRDLDAALKRSQEPWLHRLRAECLEALGRIPEAIEAADQALALDPRLVAGHRLRGHCLFHRKRYDEAAAAFSRCLRLRPQDSSLLARRADALWLAGRRGEAERDLRRCLSLEPGSLRHKLALARLQILGGRNRRALPALRALARSGVVEQTAAAAYLFGILHFRRGRFLSAARAFEQAERAALAGRFPGTCIGTGLSRMARGFEFMRRHRRSRRPAKPAQLILTGLGLDYPRQATLEVLEALSECDIVVNNLAGAETMEFLSLFCRDVRTVSFEGEQPRRWADKIFQWLKPGVRLAFVTRGHPLVSGHLALDLLRRARRRQVQVRCYSAVSSVDQMLALTQEVLGETSWGVQVLDSQLLLAGKARPQAGLPLLLYLASSESASAHRRAIARLCAALRTSYRPGQRVLVFGPRYDSRKLEPLRLDTLEAFLSGVERRTFSSMILLLPAAGRLAPTPAARMPKGGNQDHSLVQ